MYEHKANKWKIEIIITKKYINSSKKIKKIKSTRQDLSSIESLFNNYISITKK